MVTPGSTGEAILSAEGLTVRLGGVTVLREVSVKVAAGEVLGVFGPSGAGKSTLFRALTGEEPLTAGRVRIGAEDVTRMPLWKRARRGLGYVPQTPSVLFDLTVLENLSVFHRLARAGRGAESDDPAAILAELGLDGRSGVKAASLSGGERRRLEIARAILGRPRALLCDEPFAAIDPLGTARVAALLRALAEGGAAVIIADHHVAETLDLCDRALLLLEGEVALDAPSEDFRRHPLVQKHYVGQRTGDPNEPG